MKPLPPTLRTKKRYVLAAIEPVGAGADQKELYRAVSCALTSLFGDVRAAMISPAVIDSVPGHLIVRCNRGGEHDLRIALATVTVAGVKPSYSVRKRHPARSMRSERESSGLLTRSQEIRRRSVSGGRCIVHGDTRVKRLI